MLGFAEFYALMPTDNPSTIAPGASVSFPRVGPADGSQTILQMTPTTFELTAVGTYEVTFQVSVSEPGQLALVLNGSFLGYTMVGRSTGSTQLIGDSLATTNTIDSIFTVQNPSIEVGALTITPEAGGSGVVPRW